MVAGNNPVRVPVGVGELFTQPGLPDSGFAGDDNTATSGRDGVDVLAHFGSGTDAGHGDGRFDGVPFRDGTEVELAPRSGPARRAAPLALPRCSWWPGNLKSGTSAVRPRP